MTSRREFLSNAFGIAVISATHWPIRAVHVSSTQEQIQHQFSDSVRSTNKASLRWYFFLAPSIPAITSYLPRG